MSNLGTMRAKIADEIDRDDLNTQIDKEINRAITFYQAFRFWFNESVSTFSTVASQETYDSSDGVPSSVLQIDALQVTDSGGSKDKLIQRPYTHLLNLSESSTTGLPYEFSYYQDKIYLYPIPDKVYTMTLSHVKGYSELTNDSDSNDFTNEAEDLIESRASSLIYKKILKDRESARSSSEDEVQALAALLRKTNMLVSTGTLSNSGF